MKQRMHIVIRGAVQGVGFRPFVYRLAASLGLAGHVTNSSQGVVIDAEGDRAALASLLLRLEAERPPMASIASLEYSLRDPSGATAFAILPSAADGAPSALVLPDIATCADCRRELFDPADRRHRYPFVNCTNCGPRYSIVLGLPYDRALTTMHGFRMCPECEAEYRDPADRRFHAQPNACPRCGPWLELWDPAGRVMAGREEALERAVGLLREGGILAVKGIGGFHLMCDAQSDEAVRRLRLRKRREEKPLALMVADVAGARSLCRVSPLEERLLRSAEAPIVLLERHGTVAPSVAPGNPSLGVMLAYSPLHLLILDGAHGPLVATSGNLSDEPIAIDEREALARLGPVADLFLVHNRPIARQIDDSVVRVVRHRELVLRRSRGYAPLPVEIDADVGDMLAVGAQLKSAVAVARGRLVFVSQHLGDLETDESRRAFARECASLQSLYRIRPERVVSDMHPDYLSTVHARALALPLVAVQHHEAHVASCMAENALEGEVLGVSWDGTGYGPDGTVWGGEFLISRPGTFERFAALRTFRLPGGESAVREPRRSALGLLHEISADAAGTPSRASFSGGELRVLDRMLERGVNAPLTSSAGRLFDAVSSLLGIRHVSTFEGQAAMELEWAASGHEAGPGWRIELCEGDRHAVADWEPLVRAIIRWRGAPGEAAARFHRSLAELVVDVARRSGLRRVALTGGCFQNRLLLELTAARLEEEGFSVYWHQRIPPNDGGIALGQIYAAARAGAARPPAR